MNSSSEGFKVHKAHVEFPLKSGRTCVPVLISVLSVVQLQEDYDHHLSAFSWEKDDGRLHS